MTDDELEERRAQLSDQIGALLTEYQDCLGPELGLPVISDWVLVVATDDATDNTKGTVRMHHPAGQWRHRTVGLLISACDDERAIVANS